MRRRPTFITAYLYTITVKPDCLQHSITLNRGGFGKVGDELLLVNPEGFEWKC